MPSKTAKGEPIYSIDQIKVPAGFPDLLKNYTKYILNQQPEDLIQASSDYFAHQHRLARSNSKKGPTALQLEMLFGRFVQKNEVDCDLETIMTFSSLCQISSDVVKKTIEIGEWTERIPWLKFWSLLATSSYSDLISTMDTIASIMAGENGKISTKFLLESFNYLASRDKTFSVEHFKIAVKALSSDPEIHKLQASEIFKNMAA